MQERGLKILERKLPFNFLEGPSRVPGAGRSDIMPHLYPEGQSQKQTIMGHQPRKINVADMSERMTGFGVAVLRMKTLRRGLGFLMFHDLRYIVVYDPLINVHRDHC